MSEIKPHPIQMQTILPRLLFFESFRDPDPNEDFEEKFIVETGASEYNSEEKTIVVGMFLENDVEDNNEKAPFKIKVEVWAKFSVDETIFPPEKVDDWASRNAPFILFPYLREHAYSLSIRAGFKPIILPLAVVPTLKIVKQPPEE